MIDLRWILKSPLVYQTYQTLVGGIAMRDDCLRMLAAQPEERILDIGCGPAYYLPQMPRVEYHGFDTDEAYIRHARKRYGHRGNFYCAQFTSEAAQQLGKFDGVLLMGLLHHLDDDECGRLLGLLASLLRPEGRLIALDTTVHDEQNKLESWLARGDRGQYVRTPTAFTKLARQHFGQVSGHLAVQWHIPSIYWAMEMRVPRKTSST